MEESRLEALQDRGGRGVGAEREDRDSLQHRIGVQAPDDLARAAVEVEVEKVDVDQDHLGPLAARDLDREVQIGGAKEVQVFAGGDELLDVRQALGVVLHVEQAAAP